MKAAITIILLPALWLALAPLHAQVISDKPVVLQGATPIEKQVENLADPATEGEALNARTAQRAGYIYAEATGIDTWTVTLVPEPASLTAGMKLMVKAAADNTGPVTVDLNALGTWYVVKNGSQPLEAGDVAAGEMVAIVYDGIMFHLLGARRLERRPCPSGFAQVNELYCIEQNERDSLDYYDAGFACGSLNARLCTWGEWFSACTQSAALGLINMNGNWEWTNNAANADFGVRVVGQADCPHSGVTDGSVNARNFRCCYKR